MKILCLNTMIMLVYLQALRVICFQLCKSLCENMEFQNINQDLLVFKKQDLETKTNYLSSEFSLMQIFH